MEHAHQMGIIHRDLKPSNILVSDKEGDLKVRVIDFGIAKTLHRLIDETLFTRHDQLIGTPEYMSPEQLRLDDTVVDTRTDVYSLGVLLYEMLAGVSPFGMAVTGANTLASFRDAILHREPQRASTVSTQITLDSVFPVSDRTLKGDIDWILLKAIEKERNRRYSTVQELAEDVRRHLRDVPVSAGPPSLVYKVGKFVRRNNAATAVGALLLLTGLLLGLSLASAYGTIKQQSEDNLLTFKKLVEFSPSPMMNFDAKTKRMLEVNQAALDFYGYTREEFLTLTVMNLSAEPQSTARTVGEIIAGEITYVPRRAFKRKDGTVEYAGIYTGKYELGDRVIISGVLQPLALDSEGADPDTAD